MYIDISKIPKNLKEIKVSDGRPAYIFVPYEGMFPTKQNIKGKEYCPYCGRELENEKCSCFSYKRIEEFNNTLKPDG